MSDDLWKKCAVVGWRKLSHHCEACGKGSAQVEFTFSCAGLPDNYVKAGVFTRYWHWRCLPAKLKELQRRQEAELIS